MKKIIIPEKVKEIITDAGGNYKGIGNKINTEVRFCKRCVISNQRPRITINEDGICSACHYADVKHNLIDWKDRENMLLDLLARYRRNDGSYDCLVPVSGGKDSAFVAHQLKYKYNMNPLTVTFAPIRWTEIGWRNLLGLIDAGFDNLINIPSTDSYRLLVRLSTEFLGDPFQPFVYGVKSFPINIALKYNIKLIFYGENGEVEYGGDMRNADKFMHDVSDDLRDHYFKGMMPSDWVKYGIKKEYLLPFTLPNPELVEKADIKCTWFSFFKKWTPQWNYYYAVENTNFEPEPDGRSEGTYSKYASLDDKFDGFHYYLGFIKFGIGRTTSDCAHEIRDKHITREEAVALVSKYDGEFPIKNFSEFLDYIDINENKWEEIVEKFRNPWIWVKDNGNWKLRHNIAGNGVEDKFEVTND